MLYGITACESLRNPLRQSSALFFGSGVLFVEAEILQNPIMEDSAVFSGSGVINVNATIPFRPIHLATLVGWWDASDTSTLTDAGSGHCSLWKDKSSNANDMPQTTDSNRPIITSGGINSLTTLTFNAASNQFFQKITCSGLPNLGAGIGFGVVIHSTDTASHAIWDISDTTNTNKTGFLSQESNITLRSQGANASTATFSDTTAPHVISGSISTTLRDVYLDGTQGTPNSTAQTNVSSNNMRIGRLFQDIEPMAGEIAELVLFSGADSTSRQKVEGYMAWKWGLDANLPVGHPYKSAAP